MYDCVLSLKFSEKNWFSANVFEREVSIVKRR